MLGDTSGAVRGVDLRGFEKIDDIFGFFADMHDFIRTQARIQYLASVIIGKGSEWFSLA